MVTWMGEKLEIGSEELWQRLKGNGVDFVLDLRREEEFADWRIEGPAPVATVNIPQLDFVGEEEKYLERLPREKEMVIVCAHGDAAKYEAELLRERGYRAEGLIGGMDAWSVLYRTSPAGESPLIRQIYRVAKGCITHVVIAGGEAAVIDAVRHLDPIRAVLAHHGAKLRHVFDTHLQADHISGGRELAAAAGCPYHLSPVDGAGAAFAFEPLLDGQEFRIGPCRLRALHTPGHTPGSTSLLVEEKVLFSGDTVMATTVGRPDLGGMVDEWAGLLYDTVHHRLSVLADAIVVLPSHAASVREMDAGGVVQLTIGAARRELPHFALADRAAFIALVKANLLENPARYQDIRRVNLGQLDPDEKGRQELEIGQNLCGMAGKK